MTKDPEDATAKVSVLEPSKLKTANISPEDGRRG